MKHRRPTTLEPLSAALFVIVSLHLAAAFAVWWWYAASGRPHGGNAARLMWLKPGDFQTAPPPSAAAPKAVKISNAAPKKIAPEKTTEPPVQKATLVAAPAQQHQMEPVPNTTGSTPLFAVAAPAAKTSANRSITLRRTPSPAQLQATQAPPPPPIVSPTLMDIARLNAMRPLPVPGTAVADADADVNMDAVDEALNTAFLASWTAPPIEAVPASQRGATMNIAIGKDGTVLKSQMSKFSGSHALDQSILEAAARVKKIAATLPANFSKDSYDLELNFLLLP